LDTPIQSYNGQATEASKSRPTTLPPPLASKSGESDADSDLSENALV